MNAGFLDVLLNARDHTCSVVSERIDIKLRGLFQKLVDQHWTIRRETDSVAHVSVECVLIVNDRHRASTEHITRAHEHRITNAAGNLSRLFDRPSHTVVRLRYAQLFQQRSESLPI